MKNISIWRVKPDITHILFFVKKFLLFDNNIFFVDTFGIITEPLTLR